MRFVDADAFCELCVRKVAQLLGVRAARVRLPIPRAHAGFGAENVQAFKLRALQTHPDQNPDENTHHLFQQVCLVSPCLSRTAASRIRRLRTKSCAFITIAAVSQIPDEPRCIFVHWPTVVATTETGQEGVRPGLGPQDEGAGRGGRKRCPARQRRAARVRLIFFFLSALAAALSFGCKPREQEKRIRAVCCLPACR